MSLDLITEKINKAFRHIDAAATGTITRDDLLSLGNQLLSAVHEQISSPLGAHLLDTMIAYWEGLTDAAGLAHTSSLNADEFDTALRALTFGSDPDGYHHIVAPMWQATLNVADFDGDGLLHREEFTAVHLVWGTNIRHISPSFDIARGPRRKQVHISEVMRALREFHTSHDADAPGNAFFGPLQAMRR